MSPFLVAEGVHKSYRTAGAPIHVLRGLDLSADRGEMIAVVGASGVGKSTLLHVLGGLDRFDGGAIRIGEADLSAMSDAEVVAFRNRNVGFVFQFHHLLPEFNALENVMMPGLIRGLRPAEAEQRARTVLERVGLEARLTHKPGELSGGEQQRVAVARAVAMSPRVVMADEPTGNLDPVTGAEVHTLLMDLNRDHGITLVIVTHNEELSRLAHRTLRLQNGKLH